MAVNSENRPAGAELSDGTKIADRKLLEERAANNGTVIVIKNGVSQLVSARKILNELLGEEEKNTPKNPG